MHLFTSELILFLEKFSAINIFTFDSFSIIQTTHFKLIVLSVSDNKQYDITKIRALKLEHKQHQEKLILLWEDVWISKKEIVKARLKSFFGNTETIFARKTQLQVIDHQIAVDFLEQHHLLGGTKAKYKFGLYLETELVAVATFGPSLYMKNEVMPYISYGWIRYASKNGFTVVGGMSKIMSHFVKLVKPGGITTYVDFDWTNGESYEKLGFELVEITPCQTFCINDKLERIYPQRISESMEFIENQKDIVFNTGNLKYIKRFYEQ